MNLITLDDVSIHRNRITILDRISCRIEIGQHTVILGPNGSGKTSLLKLLMRFFYPSAAPDSSGTVSILGRSEWNVWELRQNLGYINSEIDFHFSHGRSGRLTGIEAVLTGFSASELEIESDQVTPAMQHAAIEALRLRGVLHLSHRPVAHLSTGERRRILLARAMVHQPKALILDEPTTGLDLGARQSLLDELKMIAAAGTTLVLVTHHVEEIIPAMQHLLLLESGRVVYQGDRAKGLTKEALSQLFKVSVRLEQDANAMLRASVDDGMRP